MIDFIKGERQAAWKEFFRSIKASFSHGKEMIKLVLAPLALIIIINLLQSLWTYHFYPEELKEGLHFSSGFSSSGLGTLILNIFSGLLFLKASVTIQRYLILGEGQHDSFFAQLSFGRRELRYTWTFIKFILLNIVISFGIIFLMGSLFLGGLVLFQPEAIDHFNSSGIQGFASYVLVMNEIIFPFLILTLLAIYLIVPFFFVFPASACDEPISFANSWRQTKGAINSLFWCFLFNLFLLFLVVICLGFPLFGLLGVFQQWTGNLITLIIEEGIVQCIVFWMYLGMGIILSRYYVLQTKGAGQLESK